MFMENKTKQKWTDRELMTQTCTQDLHADFECTSCVHLQQLLGVYV